MIVKTISHYKILEKFREGGRGVVYKAEDLKLNQAAVRICRFRKRPLNESRT